MKFVPFQSGYESVLQPVGWAKSSSHLNNFHSIFLKLMDLKSNLCCLSQLSFIFYLLEPRGWRGLCALPANGLQRLPWCLTASDGLRVSPGTGNLWDKGCVSYLSALGFTQREALRLLLLHGPSSKNHLRSLFIHFSICLKLFYGREIRY